MMPLEFDVCSFHVSPSLHLAWDNELIELPAGEVEHSAAIVKPPYLGTDAGRLTTKRE